MFANLLQQFANQVGQVTNIADSIQTSLTGARRVFEVLDAPIEVDNADAAASLPKIRGAVPLRGRRFRLPRRRAGAAGDRLSKPSRASAWRSSARPGPGKSTLLSLIPRFYDPTAGRVLIDGVDVRRSGSRHLRRSIGLVFQESFLFSNTVAANIAFGHPEATREPDRAGRPDRRGRRFHPRSAPRLRHRVGEYGANLSGGQRQRLAIARAILLEPPILILDDASASIDPDTEHEILEAMEAAMRGPHHVRRRPPPEHAAPGRSGGRARRRPDRRAGHARRIDASRGHYLASARIQAADGACAMPAAERQFRSAIDFGIEAMTTVTGYQLDRTLTRLDRHEEREPDTRPLDMGLIVRLFSLHAAVCRQAELAVADGRAPLDPAAGADLAGRGRDPRADRDRATCAAC